MTDVRPFPCFRSINFDSMDFESMDFESNRSVRRGADRTMRTAIPRRFEEL